MLEKTKVLLPEACSPRTAASGQSIPVTVISKTCQSLRHCGFWKCHTENQQKRNNAIWQKRTFSCQVLNNVLRGRRSVTDILEAFGKQDQDQFSLPASVSHSLVKFKQGHCLLQSNWLPLSPASLRKFRPKDINHLSFLFLVCVLMFSTLASLKK